MENLGELLATATEQGIRVVTVQSKEALGAAFGVGSTVVITHNGGKDNVQVVVDMISEAISSGVGETVHRRLEFSCYGVDESSVVLLLLLITSLCFCVCYFNESKALAASALLDFVIIL